MIKIGQIQGNFFPRENIFKKGAYIKKIGIQADYFKVILFINRKEIEIGNTHMIQFDDLNEKITSLYFVNKNKSEKETIFTIIDYEERIDE